MKLFSKVFTIAACAAVALSFTSCASTGSKSSGPVITKVNPYYLKPGRRIDTTDQMISFEQRHVLHGAVESQEFMERFGHYFAIFWKGRGAAAPITVRLEYTQGTTGPEIHTQEVVVSNIKGKNTTKFEVTGPDYLGGGPVTSWRAVLLSGETELSESKSFLWK